MDFVIYAFAFVGVLVTGLGALGAAVVILLLRPGKP